jgi:hypothetical protein
MKVEILLVFKSLFVDFMVHALQLRLYTCKVGLFGNTLYFDISEFIVPQILKFAAGSSIYLLSSGENLSPELCFLYDRIYRLSDFAEILVLS